MCATPRPAVTAVTGSKKAVTGYSRDPIDALSFAVTSHCFFWKLFIHRRKRRDSYMGEDQKKR